MNASRPMNVERLAQRLAYANRSWRIWFVYQVAETREYTREDHREGAWLAALKMEMGIKHD